MSTGRQLARRLATTVYLYSLTRDVPGVRADELYVAVLDPGDDANWLQRSLDGLEGCCWYLHADVRGYRFSTEASLVKLIQEAETEISVSKARARATKILSEQFKDGVLKVRRAWEDSKVPDNAEDAWLVILHWDDFGDVRGVDPHAPLRSRVRQLWEKAPIGGLREYRNRLVSLAPTAGTHGAMVRAVRTLLALELLSASAAILTALSTEKWAELKDKAKGARRRGTSQRLARQVSLAKAKEKLATLDHTLDRSADDHRIPYLGARRDQVIPYPLDQRFP